MLYFRLTQLADRLKKSTNFKNGIIFSFFAFLNNGVNFIMLMLLADFLTPNSYGTLNLFNTTITVFNVLVPLGCAGFIGVSYFKKTQKEFVEIINTIFSIASVIVILFILLLLVGKSYWERILGFSIDFQIVALLICFFQLFNTVNLEIWRLQEKPVAYGLYSFGIIALNFILTFLFILGFKMDWEGRVYAHFAATLIFFFISLVFLFRRHFLTLRKIRFSVVKEVLLFGIPLVPHLISSWIRQGLDRYILNSFWSVNAVGLFSFALNFGNIIHMVGIAFNLSNSVFIYKKLANEDSNTKKTIVKQTYLMVVLFFLVTVFVFIGSYILIPYIFPKYIDCLPYLFPLCLGAFFQCVYYLFVNYLFFYKKTKTLMYITISISILHFLMSYLFTKYATLYVAYINLLSSFTICLLVIIYSQKIYPLFKKNTNEK